MAVWKSTLPSSSSVFFLPFILLHCCILASEQMSSSQTQKNVKSSDKDGTVRNQLMDSSSPGFLFFFVASLFHNCRRRVYASTTNEYIRNCSPFFPLHLVNSICNPRFNCSSMKPRPLDRTTYSVGLRKIVRLMSVKIFYFILFSNQWTAKTTQVHLISILLACSILGTNPTSYTNFTPN